MGSFQFIFSQICGILVSVSAITSMQLKNLKAVLVCQVICNGLGALSYVLLDGLSGCGIYLVALAQSITYFIFSLTNKNAPPILSAVFVVSYILCSVFTYSQPVDIIAGLAALTCAFALIQKKPFIYRLLMVGNSLCWVMYDIGVLTYGMLISHVLVGISAIVGIIRIDLMKKQS